MSFDNQGGQQSSQDGGNSPVLTNNQEGAAAWLNTDKNGNIYVSVKLPLGLGSLNLFPADDEHRDGFNKLAEHLQA